MVLAAVTSSLAALSTLSDHKANPRGFQPARMQSGGPSQSDNGDDNDKKKNGTSFIAWFEEAADIGSSIKDKVTKAFVTSPSGTEEDREKAKAKRKDDRLNFLEQFNKTVKHGSDYIKDRVEGISELKDMASTVNSLMGSGWTSKNKDEALEDLISKAREAANAGSFQSNQSFTKMVKLFLDEQDRIRESLENAFGHIDFRNFNPTSLFYYLEYEDERKNPSWKRRKHRFTFGADVDDVRMIHEALGFADAAYFDTEKEIKEMLEEKGFDMVFLSLESLPGKPAHYIAIKEGKGFFEPTEVLIVVRGTKTIADMFTDAMLDPEEYEGGYAHAGFVRSARWLRERHKDLINDIHDAAKRKVNFKIIGHSLGAGIATIAAIEMKKAGFKNIEVVNFGCPALLSRELSERCQDYVTTVVNDSDVIPRSSGATIANLAYSVMSFNYTDRAKRDVREAIQQLRWQLPFEIDEKNIDKFIEQADDQIEKYLAPSIKDPNVDYAEPILFPPGTCLHIYRDGMGVSCSYVPCDFFSEVDVQRSMIDDHLITGYDALISELLRDHES